MTDQQATDLLALVTEIRDLLSVGLHFSIAFGLVYLSLHQFNRFFGK